MCLGDRNLLRLENRIGVGEGSIILNKKEAWNISGTERENNKMSGDLV